MKYSPVSFFAFNRPHHTFKSLQALAQNNEAKETDLYVFIDGYRKNSEIHLIDSVEKVIKSFSSQFKSLTIKRSDINLSLGTSLYRGLNEVFKYSKSLICLEDDIVVSKYFLSYLNEALNIYSKNKNIWHINSYSHPINYKTKYDCFFSKSMMAWGFATWKDRWTKFIEDPLARDPYFLKEKFDKKMIRELDFDLNRSINWFQVEDNASGKLNNTWAIFWYCYIFLNNGLCLSPKVSLSKNIGHDGSGIHTSLNMKFLNSQLREQKIKYFPLQVEEDKSCYLSIREYLRIQNSIQARVYRKLFTIARKIKSKFYAGIY